MDRFNELIGPDVNTNAINIANRPYAALRLSKFSINLLLDKILGIGTPGKVGILGKLAGVFDASKTKGRGENLHLHLVGAHANNKGNEAVDPTRWLP